MWCATHARRPRATQNVLLSSAPQPARAGRRRRSASTLGTAPRERRSGSGRPRATRSTESSVRVWIGRSWSRNASAIVRQPRDARRRPRTRSARRRRCRWSSRAALRRRRAAGGGAGCTGASRPAPPCAARPRRPPGRRAGARRSRSAGRARAAAPPRPARARPARCAASRSAAISANGFSSRCLRARSVATACSSPPGRRDGTPPIPFTATIAPPAEPRPPA